VFATLVVIGFVFLALFGEQVAPYAYDANAFSDDNLSRFQKPDCSLGELVKSYVTDDECLTPFGTDNLGQDIYSRVILGSREIFRLAGIGTLVAVIIGSMVGLLIGYYGGLVDEVVGRLLDSFMSIPVLLLALVLFGALGDADNGILIVLIIVYSPIVARVVRSNVLELRTRGFVEAARLRGESTWYILGREILPSVLPALVVEASLRFSYAIFLVASLGFLGLGADPPTPNWGLMVFEPYDSGSYRLASWTITYPAAAIAVLVVSVNIMSDGIKRIVQRS
jgi:peptide/nickel transport system permease protein